MIGSRLEHAGPGSDAQVVGTYYGWIARNSPIMIVPPLKVFHCRFLFERVEWTFANLSKILSKRHLRLFVGPHLPAMDLEMMFFHAMIPIVFCTIPSRGVHTPNKISPLISISGGESFKLIFAYTLLSL